MSIYAIGKIKLNINIDNPIHKSLLEEVLREIAKELGGELVKNAYVEGFSFRKRVPYLIHVELRYGNGYGVEINNGEIIVHADIHGAKYTSEAIAKMIAQRYVTKAVVRVAKKLNKRVDVKRIENKNVVIVYER